MTAEATTCMVIDEPLEQDRRVQAALAEHKDVCVVPITLPNDSAKFISPSLSTIVLLLRALLTAAPLFFKLWPIISPYNRYGVFAGLTAAWRLTRAAIVSRRDLAAYRTLHANDLYCAVAAVLAAPSHARVIYDSHELQFHRNRKTGWLRILIEVGLESIVLQRTDELRVVSYANIRLMEKIYGMLPEFRVVYNNFYSYHDFPLPQCDETPSIVYVGKGLTGRMLEVLDRPFEELGTKVFIYTIGTDLPKNILGSDWIFGSKHYENELLELVKHRRCIMWCCHEDTCLSYKYALPNKFFQAVALGIPSIAFRGTYMAEIIEKYDLGAIYDREKPASHLMKASYTSRYQQWHTNNLFFRELLQRGEVRI